ncbi:metallophosphoesterase [Bacillus sp. AFS002410]|uniref:metallophosphoesterase n=1 Tax=Bacillus sp. AFS002410 TaxID=2033481 RepID=UPI000BEF8517|nr:metallophosphoesterase [Bacillus sp. AFS002410]PEJ57191.1 metallophosphoesterase [Bacillus sp. AFS002410]
MKYILFRKLIRRLIVFILILLIFPIMIYSYSKSIEPKMLDLNQISISSKSVTKSMEGLKIVQFSDSHLGEHFSLKQLKNVVNQINKQKPDIIVFTGDLIDNSSIYNKIDQIPSILQQLKAKYGKYAIYGNHDVGGAGKKISSAVFVNSGFTVLENNNVKIKLKNIEMNIIGLDDYLLGRPNPTEAFKDIDKNAFNLLLVHEPDVADRLKEYPIDLQLSGHSHGGQVKLPFHEAIYTPPLANIYTEGLYELKEHVKPMSLYVNRGIGTTRIPFRFFSVPELTVFTLTNK